MAEEKTVVKFSKNQRFQHLLVMISFIILIHKRKRIGDLPVKIPYLKAYIPLKNPELFYFLLGFQYMNGTG